MILWVLAAHAACDEPVGNDAVIERADAASDAFVAMDDAAFAAASEQALALVPCLSEPARPSLAARIHRIRGISAFASGDTDRSQLDFAAARQVEPDFRFPAEVAPEGHPLQLDYLALDATADRAVRLPDLASGSFWINGKESFQRSANYPVLFQLVNDEGAIVVTSVLDADDAAPLDQAVIAVPVKLPDPPPEPRERARKGPNTPLLIGAAIVGSAAIGALVANRIQYGRYTTHYDEVLLGGGVPSADDVSTYDDRRASTNRMGVLATGLGVGSVGLGASAFLVGTF